MVTFVLIPGAGGAAWSWHLVARELVSRGYQAAAVDIPADDAEAGLAAYVAAVLAAVPPDTEDAVVVGQSMGALTAPLTCEPLQARLLVLVNPMIPQPGESGFQWWERTGQGSAMTEHARPLGLTPTDLADPAVLYGHDVPPDLFAEAGRRMREQSERPFAEPWPLAAWPRVPTHVIAAREDRLFPLSFQHRLAKERLALTPDEIDGGHLAMLSQPQQLVERLVSYVRDC